MSKFNEILTTTGDKLIQKRADNVTEATKQVFEDEKRAIEKKIREIRNNITNMEDLSVRSTQTLIVGENLDTNEWVKRRIDYELCLRDLNVELETVTKLIAEYFSDEDPE